MACRSRAGACHRRQLSSLPPAAAGGTRAARVHSTRTRNMQLPMALWHARRLTQIGRQRPPLARAECADLFLQRTICARPTSSRTPSISERQNGRTSCNHDAYHPRKHQARSFCHLGAKVVILPTRDTRACPTSKLVSIATHCKQLSPAPLASCACMCRARASVHASGGRELRRVRRGFPAGEVGGAGNVEWRDSHQSPLRRPKQREQLQCTYPTVSCLAHSVVVPCDNSALYASRSSLFAPYAPVSPLRI
jgi:hypothetical protein